MRHAGFFPGVAAALAIAGPAAASFHLVQIQKAIGGVNGDTSVQAVQLRYRSSGQCFLDPARLWVRDANGLNPVLLFDFSVCPPFPSPCTPNCTAGRTVLLTTANFSNVTDVAVAPDFTLANTIPAGYLAAGTLTFEASNGIVYWRLSWGGAAYAGPNGGACDNDDSPCPGSGDFGPPWPGLLPSTGIDGLEFQGLATAVSTSNANDYALSQGGLTVTNNAGMSATVTGPPCPWDCAPPPDGTVDVLDFLQLLDEWGQVGTPCDIDGSGVGVTDFLDLLDHWGDCA